MGTWDRMIAALNWSLLIAQAKAPVIAIELLASVPMTWRWFDNIGLTRFNMN